MDEQNPAPPGSPPYGKAPVGALARAMKRQPVLPSLLKRRDRAMKMQRYLVFLRETGDRVAAADAANIPAETLSVWRRHNIDDFRDREEESFQESLLHLEREAMRRALSGSDRLLEFLLERRHPKYARQGDPSGGGVTAEEIARAMRSLWEESARYVPTEPDPDSEWSDSADEDTSE